MHMRSQLTINVESCNINFKRTETMSCAEKQHHGSGADTTARALVSQQNDGKFHISKVPLTPRSTAVPSSSDLRMLVPFQPSQQTHDAVAARPSLLPARLFASQQPAQTGVQRSSTVSRPIDTIVKAPLPFSVIRMQPLKRQPSHSLLALTPPPGLGSTMKIEQL